LVQKTLRLVSNTTAWSYQHCGWHQTQLFGPKNAAVGIKHFCLGQKTLRLASNTSVWSHQHCVLHLVVGLVFILYKLKKKTTKRLVKQQSTVSLS
jgi:hypothetical protein